MDIYICSKQLLWRPRIFGRSDCQLCLVLPHQESIVNHSGQSFRLQCGLNANRKSVFVVYCLTCVKCNLQYVGCTISILECYMVMVVLIISGSELINTNPLSPVGWQNRSVFVYMNIFLVLTILFPTFGLLFWVGLLRRIWKSRKTRGNLSWIPFSPVVWMLLRPLGPTGFSFSWPWRHWLNYVFSFPWWFPVIRFFIFSLCWKNWWKCDPFSVFVKWSIDKDLVCQGRKFYSQKDDLFLSISYT